MVLVLICIYGMLTPDMVVLLRLGLSTGCWRLHVGSEENKHFRGCDAISV